MAKKTTETKTKAAEPVVEAKGTFSLTLYFFAVVNGRRFPAQQTLTCENADDFTRMLPELYAAFDPSEDDYVVYEPRDIGPVARAAPAKSGGGSGQSGQQRVLGPECPFHGIPTTQKNGPRGKFFSCSKKRDNGQWCNWTPDEEE